MNLRIILGSPDRKDQSSLFLLKRLQSGTQRVQACGNKSKNSVCLPITPSSLSQLHTSRESTGHPDRLRFVGCGCFMLCRFLSLRRAALNPRLTVCAVIGWYVGRQSWWTFSHWGLSDIFEVQLVWEGGEGLCWSLWVGSFVPSHRSDSLWQRSEPWSCSSVQERREIYLWNETSSVKLTKLCIPATVSW